MAFYIDPAAIEGVNLKTWDHAIVAYMVSSNEQRERVLRLNRAANYGIYEPWEPQPYRIFWEGMLDESPEFMTWAIEELGLIPSRLLDEILQFRAQGA